MKINLFLTDTSNVILGYQEFPIDTNLPILEIDDPTTLDLGYDIYNNGEIIHTRDNPEKTKQQKKNRIAELKILLQKSDYQAIKHSEGLITEEDYLPIKTFRQSYRDEINQLEEEIAAL